MIEILCKLPERLIPWYSANRRDLPWRKDREPYHIWISEIMLQQTRVEAVKAYYNRFLQQIPSIQMLATVEDEILLKLWEGLGYYSRARNMKKAAGIIMRQYGGVFPQEYDSVLALPGIGSYTAGAILSICFNQKTPAVDGNVLRVMSRLLDDHSCTDDSGVKRYFSNLLEEVYPTEAGIFTQALMELGATVCLPAGQPLCSVCPMENLCQARQHGTASILPVRKAKKERKLENMTVFLLTCGNRLALQKRPDTGLLAGLYELPHLPGTLESKEIVSTAEAWGLRPQFLEKTVGRTHVFTHIQWNMTGARIHCGQEGNIFLWADRETVLQDIALPTAFRQFLPDIWEDCL